MFTKIRQIFFKLQELRRVLSRLSGSTSVILTASNVRCPFLDLPVEIIQMIQDLLPLASAVSLALTHRSLLQTLRNEPLRTINLPTNADQRTNFLLSLQKRLAELAALSPMFSLPSVRKGNQSPYSLDLQWRTRVCADQRRRVLPGRFPDTLSECAVGDEPPSFRHVP